MERVMMKGNEALAEGAIRAGCRFFFGYPITPQNEIPEYMARRMPEVNGVFLQAESEVSAINMIYGAGGAGARALTSSSSPGISLKQEGISYIAGAQVPCVVVNVARGGPGLGGLNPSQSDYFQATKGGGHGDYRLIVYAPGTGQEAWATTGKKGRSKPNVINSLGIIGEDLEKINIELQAKYARIEAEEVRYEADGVDDADLIVVAYGTSSRVVRSAIALLREEGKKVGLFRPITLWPFPKQVLQELANKGKKFLVVEMSAGQLVEDVILAVNDRSKVEFFGKLNGTIPTVREVYEEIASLLRKGGAK